MNNNKQPNVPASTKAEVGLELAAIVASAAPWIGGPISQIIGGIATGRKIKRVREFLDRFLQRVEKFHNEASEQFVKTEDFADIFEKTAQAVANERNEAKRALYAQYLLSNIAKPEITYDHRLKLLRILEQIDTRHLDLLRALIQKPTLNEIRQNFGAPSTTLQRRAPHLSAHLDALIHETNQLRLTRIRGDYMNTMVTGSSAANLAHMVTDLGRDLVNWLQESNVE